MLFKERTISKRVTLKPQIGRLAHWRKLILEQPLHTLQQFYWKCKWEQISIEADT